MAAGETSKVWRRVRRSDDGHEPVSKVNVAGRAGSHAVAPTNYELERAIAGWGPSSVGTFRAVCAELLDYREARLPRVPETGPRLFPETLEGIQEVRG